VSDSLVLGARLLELSVATSALWSSGVQVASRLTPRADLRLLSAFTLCCFAAIVEALGLGLFGIGENDIALLVATLALWALGRRLVGRADGPTMTEQIRGGLHRLSVVEAAGIGAVVVAVVAALIEALVRPYSSYDALQYHMAQPVIWLTNGHPGSLHVVNIQTPLQAYPKNTEVLLGWLLGLSHALLVGTLLMFAFLVMSAIALVAALARMGVARRSGAFLTLAVLTLPVSLLQIAGASTDLATLCWIVVTAALCLGALETLALLPVALLAAGLAMGTKASAAVPIAVVLVVTIWLVRSRLGSAPRLPLGAGAIGAVGLGGIWYLQDWIVYGAPLYPFSRVPSGPRLPQAITAFNTSFVEHPITALRVGTFHGYLEWFGGGPFLVIAALLAIAAVPVIRRGDRRALLVALAAAVAALIVWGVGPFTGYPGVAGTTWFPLNGTRYLLPSMPIIVLPLAMLLRRDGWLQRIVLGLLVVVIVVNFVELRHWPVPVRPAGPIVFAAGVIGAVAAAFLAMALAGGAPRVHSSRAGIVTVAVGLVTMTALLGAVASGYTGREVPQHVRAADDPFSVRIVIGWLNTQSDWVHGSAPVAAGPILDTLLAGPRLSHRLVLIPQSQSCTEVRAVQRRDWVVVPKSVIIRSGPYRFASYNRDDCFTAPPAFAGGGYLIYRPG
jgi:hypothetical protein